MSTNFAFFQIDLLVVNISGLYRALILASSETMVTVDLSFSLVNFPSTKSAVTVNNQIQLSRNIQLIYKNKSFAGN